MWRAWRWFIGAEICFQNLPRLGSIGWANKPFLLKEIQKTGSTSITDFEATLQKRSGGFARTQQRRVQSLQYPSLLKYFLFSFYAHPLYP
jgi:hypothetical protein